MTKIKIRMPKFFEFASNKLVIPVHAKLDSRGISMVMGEKLFEEKGKITMTFVDSIDATGIVMKQSFSSEVTGFGRCPSGMNMGSGTVCMHQDGKAHGKWVGMMMTEDNEMITWKASGHSKRSGEGLKGIMVITFMTKSEKYEWINSIIAVADLESTMIEFSDVAYEWE